MSHLRHFVSTETIPVKLFKLMSHLKYVSISRRVSYLRYFVSTETTV